MGSGLGKLVAWMSGLVWYVEWYVERWLVMGWVLVGWFGGLRGIWEDGWRWVGY